MKKLLCIFMSLILIFSISTVVYAETTLAGVSYSFMPDVNGTAKSMIHNDYYKLYYNDIFEAEYANLKHYSIEGMTDNTLSMLTDENYIYATVILADNDATAYAEHNKSILTTVIDDADILYVGDTTPFSVIKLTKAKADVLAGIEHIRGIFPAFFTANILTSGIVGEKTLGDVNGSNSVSSADARLLLRFSAGLETVDKSNAKQFYLCGDMNFDGSITSADARIALRTAAGLEKKVSVTFSSADCWEDFR